MVRSIGMSKSYADGWASVDPLKPRGASPPRCCPEIVLCRPSRSRRSLAPFASTVRSFQRVEFWILRRDLYD